MHTGHTEEVSGVAPLETVVPDNLIFVPHMESEISAGNGLEASDAVQEYVAFKCSWLQHLGPLNALAILTVRGESMYPTLYDGDQVMIHKQRTQITGEQIYALSLDHVIMVKRLQAMPGGKIRIISDNLDQTRFPPQEADPRHDQVRVFGQVVWISHVIGDGAWRFYV